jgi:DNA repair protein RadA/Sms
MAVVSSFKNKSIDNKMIAIGEVGLSGEVRAVNQIQARVQEAKKLGFTSCVIPAVCLESVKEIKDIKITGVKTVKDAMNLL